MVEDIVARDERDFTRCEVLRNDVGWAWMRQGELLLLRSTCRLDRDPCRDMSRLFRCFSHALQAVPQRRVACHGDTDHPFLLRVGERTDTFIIPLDTVSTCHRFHVER
jgi:hypothetical protein